MLSIRKAGDRLISKIILDGLEKISIYFVAGFKRWFAVPYVLPTCRLRHSSSYPKGTTSCVAYNELFLESISTNIVGFYKIIVLTLCISIISSCTVVPDEKKSAEKEEKLDIYFVSDDFKPDEYAEKVWEDRVIPLFLEKSKPIESIIPVWTKDQQTAGTKFGYREKAEGSPWNFRVKGSGIIVAVNIASRASTIDIDLSPGDGTTDLILQIGPVIKDSAIRDSLDFISFTDFTNQLEFARLSNAFNKVVNRDVVSKLDRENLMGKKVSFWGAFTQLQDSELIRVTPVVIEVE